MTPPKAITQDEYLAEVIPELEAAAAEQRIRPWTSREKRILISYYGRAPVRSIAGYLNRTVASVANKAARLGLSAADGAG